MICFRSQFLALILQLLSVNMHAGAGTKEIIRSVENNLLPAVLIAGEPTLKLEDRMAHYRVPGIGIAVIKDFKLHWSKYYGVMDSETNQPVSSRTRFNVGSLSKGLAALTALNLVDNDILKIDDNVNIQLVSWKIPENELSKQGTITPLLLMNHSSGIMHSPAFGYTRDALPNLIQVLDGGVAVREKATIVDKVPGTIFQYSNPAFGVLQLLSTDLTQQNFPRLTQSRIFKPLKMKNTTFQQPLAGKHLKYAASGHFRSGEVLPDKRYYHPNMAAGGLWSTPVDYAKFVIELQKSVLSRSNKIISPETARAMLSPHVSGNYGLGVFLREMEGEQNYFGHMGDTRGFFAGYIAHMTDGYAAIIFTNSQNGASLIREIMGSIAQVYGWEKYLPPEHKVAELDQEAMGRYCGQYALGSDDGFEVRLQDGSLHIDAYDGMQLYPVDSARFITKFRPGHIEFFLHENSDSISAEFHFADDLGRFIGAPKQVRRMQHGEYLPSDLLRDDQIALAIQGYQKIRDLNPADPAISEDRLNRLGYALMGNQKLEAAQAILHLNVELYPESANCYDSLAESYMKHGDNESAIAYYRKALVLNPNSANATQMLKKLGWKN